MIDQLRKIAENIGQLLEEDEFPFSIRPDYLAEAVRAYPVHGGKRLRPALLIWSCGLLGGEEEKALYPAAAVEVYHNWTLVHDDIIDQDDTRRGMPTAHVQLATVMKERFGLPPEEAARAGRDFAILAGDLQQGWANDLLLRSTEHGVSAEVAVALSRNLQKLANCELICGEALDVEFSLRELAELHPDSLRRMLSGKTSALLEFCTQTGGMIALNESDPEREEIVRLGQFARAAGIAFQLRDDYLGIFGDFHSLGKPLGNDLREGKATILLLETMRMASPADREELQSLIGLPEYPTETLERVRRIMRDSGAAAATAAEAAQLAEQAKNILRGFPDTPARQNMLDLVNFLINRER